MSLVLLSVCRLSQGIIVLLAVSTFSTQNQPFGRDAEYFQVSKDFVFKEEKLMVLKVKNVIKCATLCSMADECNAWNYQSRLATVGQMAICEVLRLHEDPSEATLVPRIGWSAYRLEFKTTEEHFSYTTKEPEVSTKKDIITVTSVRSETTTATVKHSDATTTKDAIRLSTVKSETTTVDYSFVDNNPEYCSIDGAFVYSGQIYLVSGDAVYVYDDVDQFSVGPFKTYALSSVVPGISAPIDGIFVDETETTLNVIKGDMLIRYSTPSSTFSWTQTQQKTVAVFFGRSFETITGIYEFNGDTIILVGKKATALSTTKLTPMNSNGKHNVLLSVNKHSAPDDSSAASALTSEYVLVFNSNQVYSFLKPIDADQGTWGTLGSVRCRIM